MIEKWGNLCLNNSLFFVKEIRYVFWNFVFCGRSQIDYNYKLFYVFEIYFGKLVIRWFLYVFGQFVVVMTDRLGNLEFYGIMVLREEKRKYFDQMLLKVLFILFIILNFEDIILI